jgi:hypothetical protein
LAPSAPVSDANVVLPAGPRSPRYVREEPAYCPGPPDVVPPPERSKVQSDSGCVALEGAYGALPELLGPAPAPSADARAPRVGVSATDATPSACMRALSLAADECVWLYARAYPAGV